MQLATNERLSRSRRAATLSGATQLAGQCRLSAPQSLGQDAIAAAVAGAGATKRRGAACPFRFRIEAGRYICNGFRIDPAAASTEAGRVFKLDANSAHVNVIGIM